MPQTLDEELKAFGVPETEAAPAPADLDAALGSFMGDRYKQEWAAADKIAEVLSTTPDIGLGEQAAAYGTPPELRPLVADAVRKRYQSDQTMKRMGFGGRLINSTVKGMVDYAAPLARLTGAIPSLAPEQERFAQELSGIRAVEDPSIRPDTNMFGRGLQQAAQQTFPMTASIAAGATGAGAGLTASSAMGLGKVGTALVAGTAERIGTSGSYLPQIADDTYRQAINEGHTPEHAGLITAISAPIEAAVESFLPNPFKEAPGIFKGTVGKVARKVVTEYAKRFGMELTEEGVQGAVRETGMEVARAMDKEIPNKGIGSIIKEGWKSVQEAVLPMAIMMAPAGARFSAQAVVESGERAGRLAESQTARQGELRSMRKGLAEPALAGTTPLAEPEPAVVEPAVAPAPTPVEQPSPQPSVISDTVSLKPPEQGVAKPFAEQVADLLPDIRRVFGKRQDADDLAQDTAVKALEAEDQYDPAKGPLKPWLRTIAKNLLRNQQRDEGKSPEVQAPEDMEPAAPPTLPERVSMDDLRAKTPEELAATWKELHPRATKDPPTDRQALVRQIWAKVPSEMRVEKTLGKKAVTEPVAVEEPQEVRSVEEPAPVLPMKPVEPVAEEPADVAARRTQLEQMTPAAVEAEWRKLPEAEGKKWPPAKTTMIVQIVAANKAVPAVAEPALVVEKAATSEQVSAKVSEPESELMTISGRVIRPPIQKTTKTNRGVKQNVLAVDVWLVEEGIAEAKSKNDDFVLTQFSAIDPKRITPAERDGINIYLFGKEEVPLPPPSQPEPTKTALPKRKPQKGRIQWSTVEDAVARINAIREAPGNALSYDELNELKASLSYFTKAELDDIRQQIGQKTKSRTKKEAIELLHGWPYIRRETFDRTRFGGTEEEKARDAAVEADLQNAARQALFGTVSTPGLPETAAKTIGKQAAAPDLAPKPAPTIGKKEEAAAPEVTHETDIVIGEKSLNGIPRDDVARLLRREQEKGKPAWFDGTHLYTLSGKHAVSMDDKHHLRVENLHNLSEEGLLRWFDPSAPEYVAYNAEALQRKQKQDADEKAKTEAREAKEATERAERDEYSQKSSAARDVVFQGTKTTKGKAAEIDIATGGDTKKVKATVYGDLAVHKRATNDKVWQITHVPSGMGLPGEYGSKSLAVENAWLLNQGLDWSKKKPSAPTIQEAKKRLAWFNVWHGGAEIPAFLTGEAPAPSPTIGSKSKAPLKSALKPQEGEVHRAAMPAETEESPVAQKALSPAGVRAMNKLARQRSSADWATSAPSTEAGRKLVDRLANDKKHHVGLRSILQSIGDKLGTITIVGKSQLGRTTPARYETAPSVIRSKTGQSIFDFHEVGHALSRNLGQLDAAWMAAHEADLVALTTMQGSVASEESAEEGVAEFIRRYLTNHRSLPEGLRTDMEAKIRQLDPELLGAIQDAHRAYVLHTSRPIRDQLAADRNDKGTRKSKLTDMFGVLKSGAYHVAGKEVVPYRIRMSAERELAKHSRAVFEEFQRQTTNKKGDLYNAYASTLLAPLESTRILLGDKGGLQGVRVMAWGDETLDEDEIATMRDAGLPVPAMVPHGEWLYLTHQSFEDIRTKLGDYWEEFETWGQSRASMERLKKGHEVPWLHEGKTIEEVQEFIDQTEAEHPDWLKRFQDVQDYFDALLVVATMNGEFSAEEAATIKGAWEDYWPLQRDTAGTDSKGQATSLDIGSGVHRAFGSPLPFKSLVEAAEYRTKRTLDSFYQNRLRKSFLEYGKLLQEIEDIPDMVKTQGARLMLPLHMDRAVVARVSPETQQRWFAQEVVDAINNDRAERLGVSVEELGDDAITKDDIDITLPWRTIYKSKKPGAIQVVGVYEKGNVQYYQVLDPLLFDLFSTSRDVGEAVRIIKNWWVRPLAPWRRALTGNLVFALRNIPRDMATAYIMGEGLKSLIPGRYVARGIVGRFTGQTAADPSPRMNLYSRTLDELQSPRHQQVWDRFKQSFLDDIVQPLHVQGWQDMNTLERIQQLPGAMSSAVASPIAMFNWVTGGHWLSQLSEDLSREGAWLTARDQGLPAETASRYAAEITGNFGQRQPNAIFRNLVRGAGFLNPGLQIIWGTYRHMIDPDPNVMKFHLAVKAPLIAVIGAAASALNLALIHAMFGGGDDDKKLQEMLANMREQSDYERRTHMSVMGMFRAPFESGVHGAMFSMAWNITQDWILDGGTDAPRRIKELFGNMAMHFPSTADFIQPQIKTALEVNMGAGGFSFYKNEEIVPAYLRTYNPLDPEKQVHKDTPELYKWLYRKLGGHPLKWEYALRSLFTRQLTDTIHFVDSLNKTGKIEAKNMPILRGVLESTAVGFRSKSVQNLRELSVKVESLAAKLKDMKDPKAKAALAGQLQELHEANIAFEAISDMWEKARDEDKKDSPDKDKIKAIEQQMTAYARQYLDWKLGRRATPPEGYEQAKQYWIGGKVDNVTDPSYKGDGSLLTAYGYGLKEAIAAYQKYWTRPQGKYGKRSSVWDEKGNLKESWMRRIGKLKTLMGPAESVPEKKGFAP